MKLFKIYYLLVIVLFASCEKGDNYYKNYNSSEIHHDGTTYDFLVNQKGVYDSLILVLERLPEVKQLLSSENDSTTFFAINNRSFALAIENYNIQRRKYRLPDIGLEDVKVEVLDTLMDRYIFDEVMNVAGFIPFLDGQEILSKKYAYPMHAMYKVKSSSGLVGGGQQELMFSDTNNSIYQRYWNISNTVVVDFHTKNGIIHTLAPRHEFGFGKLTSKYVFN